MMTMNIQQQNTQHLPRGLSSNNMMSGGKYKYVKARPSSSGRHSTGSLSAFSSSALMSIGSKPSLVTKGSMRFLVMDAPRQSNLHLYIRECRKQGVTDIVRVCEPTYNGEAELAKAGISLHEMAYPDGTIPPKEVIDQWLDLVHQRFFQRQGDQLPDSATPTIAVHCHAGLGRAPVLVAIALIEFSGMDPVDAVTFIRQRRRGAINEKQLNYLEKYRSQWKGCSDCRGLKNRLGLSLSKVLKRKKVISPFSRN